MEFGDYTGVTLDAANVWRGKNQQILIVIHLRVNIFHHDLFMNGTNKFLLHVLSLVASQIHNIRHEG